jgi:formylglycine-generating enzyme required for sulfatase activity
MPPANPNPKEDAPMASPRPFALAACALPLLAALNVPAQADAPAKAFSNAVGMDFVLIPAGSFTMGRNPNVEDGFDSELPAHRVSIANAFYMQTTEVTQEQWGEVVGSYPSKFKGRSNPVEQVSWDDIQIFLKALNAKEGCSGCYRLSTEAEWEYAYRAGTKGTYYWGDDADAIGQYAWYASNSGDKTRPVGQLKPNAWGLHDMAGNVVEWVQDCYHESYSGAPADGSAWAGGCYKYSDGNVPRVLRGGSWDVDPGNCRAAVRDGTTPTGNRDHYHGFRVVRVVSARTH